MKWFYRNLYKWIICLLLVHTVIVPIQGISPGPTNRTLSFGAKLGYERGFRLIEEVISYYPVELFIAYLDPLDKRSCFPSFGSYSSWPGRLGIQIGICYRSINMQGMRHSIEPEAAYFSYPNAEMAFISFNVKTLSIPISIKRYVGANGKFCISHTIAPLFILFCL